MLDQSKYASHPSHFFFSFVCLFAVDGTFCQAALKGKIQLKEQFSKYLGGEVKLGKQYIQVSYVSEYRKRDLMAQKTFFELLIPSYSMIFEL